VERADNEKKQEAGKADLLFSYVQWVIQGLFLDLAQAVSSCKRGAVVARIVKRDIIEVD
jgi:hypothetical protein